MSEPTNKRVNPKDFRYQPNACLCWHVVLDHKDGTGECEYCTCKQFRKPPANQIITPRRREIDRTIAEQLRATKEQYNELLNAVCSKYLDETRHQTALRYITEAESKPSHTAAA